MDSTNTVFPKPKESVAERTESANTSYWLEKLFRQREKKAEDEKNDRLAKSPSPLPPQDPAEEQSVEKKRQEDATQEHIKKTEADQHQLDNMMSQSNRIIIGISSAFPWDIFPSSVNIEETRVNIIHRQLFSSQVHSVDIRNISNVFLHTSFFFASLTIVSSTFEENNIKIIRLRKKDAILARRIIEGMRMFIEKDVDTSKYTTEELVNRLKGLSTTKTVL